MANGDLHSPSDSEESPATSTLVIKLLGSINLQPVFCTVTLAAKKKLSKAGGTIGMLGQARVKKQAAENC